MTTRTFTFCSGMSDDICVALCLEHDIATQASPGDIEQKAPEPCEVMACQTGGEYGSWRILVATHDGTLLAVDYSSVKLIADPGPAGPYR